MEKKLTLSLVVALLALVIGVAGYFSPAQVAKGDSCSGLNTALSRINEKLQSNPTNPNPGLLNAKGTIENNLAKAQCTEPTDCSAIYGGTPCTCVESERDCPIGGVAISSDDDPNTPEDESLQDGCSSPPVACVTP